MKTLISAVLALVVVCSTAAQPSNAGRFFGSVTGNVDVFVEAFSKDSGNVYYFDFSFRVIDVATVSLNSAGQGFATSSLGLPVTLAISSTSATGRFGVVAFSAARQSPLGAFRPTVYTGAVADLAGRLAQSKLTILASGRVIVTAINASGVSGGTGSIASNGLVTLRTNLNTTALFAFNPQGGVALGRAAILGGLPVEFALVEAQRPALVNIATRGTVGPNNMMAAGFVCVGGAKTFLIRAVGPTLAAFGVSGAQSDPTLTLYSGSTAIGSNDNWGTAANAADIATAAGQVGAFSLVSGSADAAMLITLESGGYTVQIGAAGSAVGDALVEVYEVL